MKKYLTLGLIVISVIGLTSIAISKTIPLSETEDQKEKQKKEKEDLYARLKIKADSAKIYCKAKGLNLNYCFLVDFKIHSGKNRFFVWDFNKNTILYSGLCCHGYGKGSTQTHPVFSNVENSYCSSLGHYKIGIQSYSQWGIHIHYKMHGLDSTNSNAYQRIIVLHSHNPVPEEELYPNHLPLGYSQGCPVISNNLMRNVDKIVAKEKKPILLWIYN